MQLPIQRVDLNDTMMMTMDGWRFGGTSVGRMYVCRVEYIHKSRLLLGAPPYSAAHPCAVEGKCRKESNEGEAGE